MVLAKAHALIKVTTRGRPIQCFPIVLARMVNFDQILESTAGILLGMARFWGGSADGEICDACDKPITKQQLLMEGIASTLRDRQPVQFHVLCFQFWDTGRRATSS